MEQHATFKSSLFGFDKKRVLDYIYAFSQQAKEVEDELNRQIEGLAATRDELCKQLEDAENQFEIVNSKYNAERESSKEAARLIAELGDEIKRQKLIVEQKNRELAIQNERCHQLESKARNMEHKSKKYDELSQQVGEIVLEAQALAQQIVAQAKDRVAQLEQAQTKGLPEQETLDLRQELKRDLEKMKAGMNEMFSALSNRLEILETNSKLFGGADSRLSQEVEALKQSASKMQIDVSTLDGRLTRLEAKAAERAQMLDVKLDKVEAEAVKAVAVAEKVISLEQNTERMHTETAALAGRMAEVEAKSEKVVAVADKVNDLEQNTERLQTETAALAGRMAEVEGEAAKVAAVADKVNDLEQNTERMQAETSVLVERIAEVEARGDHEQAESAEMKEKLLWLEVNTQNVIETTTSINDKVAALENSIKASTQTNTLGGRIAELKQQVTQTANNPHKPSQMGTTRPGQTATPMGVPMANTPMGTPRAYAGTPAIPPAPKVTGISAMGMQDRIDSLLRNRPGSN